MTFYHSFQQFQKNKKKHSVTSLAVLEKPSSLSYYNRRHLSSPRVLCPHVNTHNAKPREVNRVVVCFIYHRKIVVNNGLWAEYSQKKKKIHFNVGDHHQTYWMVHLGIDVMGHPRVKQGTHYLWWFPDAYLLTCHESIRRNCALHFVVFFWFHASFKHPQSIFLPWVSLAMPI